MNQQTAIWTALAVAFILLAVGFAGDALSQDVKYCIDHRTGDIYTVEANKPCPYPTVEM